MGRRAPNLHRKMDSSSSKLRPKPPRMSRKHSRNRLPIFINEFRIRTLIRVTRAPECRLESREHRKGTVQMSMSIRRMDLNRAVAHVNCYEMEPKGSEGSLSFERHCNKTFYAQFVSRVASFSCAIYGMYDLRNGNGLISICL